MATTKPNTYATPFGVFPYSKAWSPVIKTMVRLHVVYPFVCPDDLAAFLELRLLVRPSLGQPLLGYHLVWLFLAHTIKWPGEVRKWQELLVESVPQTPHGLVAAYRSVL